MMYDYLIVGSGFFGATFARLMTDAGKRCAILETKKHIGGNAYTEKIEGIDVHMYGPHIFHTNDEGIWNFVNRFTKFNNYIHCPKAFVNGRMYSLPFNMNTFYEIWGCNKPEQAQKIIDSQKFTGEPQNLEEQALSLVGKDIYELLIKGYTEKQWMKKCNELPSFIIKRLPVRFTYDNNYFNDRYQGIPVDGYTKLFEEMLHDIPIYIMTDYFEQKKEWDAIANKIVFTGKIDEYYDYEYGELEYRTLDFEHEVVNSNNYQGLTQLNYPDLSVPWTRIIEHKHFTNVKTENTVITKELPAEWNRSKVPYYPVNDSINQAKYEKYRDRADQEQKVIFGGRLSEYKYYDMHQVIGSAMKVVKTELTK